MKNCFFVGVGVGMILLSAPEVLRAGVYNGSFESWDFIGWNFHSDVGSRATEPLTQSAGTARTMSSWGEALEANSAQTAASGYRFLGLSTRANANFLGSDTYNIFVSQSFSLNQGEAVSGWASFFDGDSAALDSAWVRILDGNANLVATPWVEISGSTQVSALAPSDWTLWQWTAPTAGNYTLQLGMTTSGANNSASHCFFDGITVSGPQVVPEPTTLALGLLGGFAILTLRNRGR